MAFLLVFVDGLNAPLCEFLQALKVDHDGAEIAIALLTIYVSVILAWSTYLDLFVSLLVCEEIQEGLDALETL